ncbi:Zinc finger RING FYVE PHD-type protein [Rutstroemia sp. NJR-2017a BBW]|nr:Zinc finger RING FYVE PHD-type protein [Rutstroemia sp. NJR-2017a BBW]
MNPYEIEHGIKDEGPARPRRRPSMSSFFNQLSQIETSDSTTDPTRQHNNPHAVPTPVDVSAAYRLLQDQYLTLRSDSGGSSSANPLLDVLIESTQSQIEYPPTQTNGCSQTYLDTVDRVPRKSLKPDETCPICGEKFLSDEYCLVIVLPCHPTHKFDLECVGPWLRINGTCPLDRKAVGDGEKMKKSREREMEAAVAVLDLDEDAAEEYDRRRLQRQVEREKELQQKKEAEDYESDGDDGMYA